MNSEKKKKKKKKKKNTIVESEKREITEDRNIPDCMAMFNAMLFMQEST